MNKLNEIFDKVYVVSYSGSTRLENLKKNLKDLDYEIFYGCNKNDLNIKDLQNKGYKRAFSGGDHMSEGVFACAFSHLYLYRMLKENDFNNVLILEDDAVLDSRYIDSTVDAYNKLPDNWDVLFLGYKGWAYSNYSDNLYKSDKYKMGDRKLNVLECTHAFAINNNFLDILLEKQENPETFGGSEFWELFYKMEIFACVNKCFKQDGSASLIGDNRNK